MNQKKTNVSKFGIVFVLISFGIMFYVMRQVNAPYKEKYATFLQTKAVVISVKDNGKSGKKARSFWQIEYRDQTDKIHQTSIQQQNILGTSVGDSVVIYYDPADPANVCGETDYKSVML